MSSGASGGAPRLHPQNPPPAVGPSEHVDFCAIAIGADCQAAPAVDAVTAAGDPVTLNEQEIYVPNTV